MQRITFHLLDIQSRDVLIEEEKLKRFSNDSDEDEMPKTKTITQKELLIHLFGVTETGQRIRCDVSGFQPTIYLRLPEQRTSQMVETITNYIAEHVSLSQLHMKRIMRKVFYGFTANTQYPFLQIEVGSLSLFRLLRGLFLNDQSRPQTKKPLGKTIEVYEANIDPMLRFLHVQNIQPCGWISVPCSVTVEPVIECTYDEVLPAAAPCVSAPFLTASWDIECFSRTGDFPVPVKTWKKTAEELCQHARTTEELKELLLGHLVLDGGYLAKKVITPIYCRLTKSREIIEKKLALLVPAFEDALNDVEKMQDTLEKLTMIELLGDPVIQIGTTIYHAGRLPSPSASAGGTTIYKNGIGALLERHLFVFPDCAPIDGIIVHAFPTEKEMICAWFEWLILMDPDILIGYNVFGFDESYLWKRAEVLDIITPNSIVHRLSRLRECGHEVKLEEKMLSSSAMGDNQMYIWSLHGRLQIDMFHYIKRNNTLGSYKLDEVTKHFMSGKLKSAVYDMGTLTLEVGGAIQDVREGRSIMLLDETGEAVSEKLIVHSVDKGVIVVECFLDEDQQVELEDARKWVIVKDDVSPADIFRLHRGSAEDRAVVGKYCLQDCDLVIELYKKLETFNNSMSMANVCSVPIYYIFVRGQGIKIESLIFKFCREKGILIPVLEQSRGTDESYEGAIVLDPEPGFYSESPIGVCDFASLYPSTIVSENISHDSLLWVKDFTDGGDLIQHQWGSEVFDECEGYAYTDIEYDIIRPDPHDMRKNPAKIKCGRRICRYAQPLDGTKSTLPQITTWLLQARSAKKKEMKKEQNPERYALLDAEQLAYKLTGNSLYGQLGSGTFKIRLQALAASVTAYGRKQILFAKDAIEKFYGPNSEDPRCAAKCCAKMVYGDSVTGNTPLVLRNDVTGQLFMRRIDELYSEDEWNTYHDTKESIELQGISVWTDRGFTPIHRLIRHRLHPDKKLFRINTHTGVVDVTEDHSLVLSNGQEARPNEVVVGTNLLHHDTFHEEFNQVDSPCSITEDEAFVMGFFVADGSSDVYDCPSGRKASWAINKADIGLLVTAMNKCPFPTKILNTIESSGVHKLVPVGNIVEVATKYRALFYNQHREKKIPDSILCAPLPVVEAFWNGFYAGDGDKDANGYIRFDQKGKEIGAGMYLLARRLGYSVSINERESKDQVFRYTMTKKTQRKSRTAIKKMRELPHTGDEYVYDLTTENHHFGIGPGALIVHNTDSLFVAFNPRNPETGERLQGREARQATIDITNEAGHFITKALAAPHDFEFDKAYHPLLLFSKKRYAGNMYEENADDYVHKYMGIALKRRDNAPIVKTIFGGAMKMLLDKQDVAGAFQFVKEKCLELVDGKVSLGQLTVTKSLRGSYANPESIAHKVLADRITARDPGNAPASGDRIGYVYIRPKAGQMAAALQGDRIETPQFIRDHRLEADYRHYIEHQLWNPISQAFGILLESIPGFTKSWLDKCPPLEDLDRYLGFREAKAGELLFRDCLRRFDATASRTAMMGMFKIAPGIKPTGLKPIGQAAMTTAEVPSINPVIEATVAIAASVKALEKGKPVQRKISGFLLDAQIVSTNDKRRAKKAKEEKEEKE